MQEPSPQSTGQLQLSSPVDSQQTSSPQKLAPQSWGQLHLVSSVAAQHMPSLQVLTPQSPGQLQLSSPAAVQQMSSPQKFSPQSYGQLQLFSLAQQSWSPHIGGSQLAFNVMCPSPACSLDAAPISPTAHSNWLMRNAIVAKNWRTRCAKPDRAAARGCRPSLSKTGLVMTVFVRSRSDPDKKPSVQQVRIVGDIAIRFLRVPNT